MFSSRRLDFFNSDSSTRNDMGGYFEIWSNIYGYDVVIYESLFQKIIF